MIVDKCMKRGIARWPLRGIADLQDVFGRVLVIEMELVHSPCLHLADPGAGRKLSLDCLVKEMHGGLDSAAPSDMNPRAMFYT
jgi:hypothetical protein